MAVLAGAETLAVGRLERQLGLLRLLGLLLVGRTLGGGTEETAQDLGGCAWRFAPLGLRALAVLLRLVGLAALLAMLLLRLLLLGGLRLLGALAAARPGRLAVPTALAVAAALLGRSGRHGEERREKGCDEDPQCQLHVIVASGGSWDFARSERQDA